MKIQLNLIELQGVQKTNMSLLRVYKICLKAGFAVTSCPEGIDLVQENDAGIVDIIFLLRNNVVRKNAACAKTNVFHTNYIFA